MNNTIISIREIQRDYRKLINKAKATKKPIYLGAHMRAEAVLLDVGQFEELQKKAQDKKQDKKNDWAEIKKTLEWIRAGGKQNVNLAKFVHEDRKRH